MHLMMLGLVCFAPAFLAIGLVGRQLAQSEQQRVERQTFMLAQQFRATIDRDIAARIATLEALATSPSIDARDFAAFQQQCEKVLGDNGTAIALREPADGQQIIDTLVPFGSRPLPRTADPVLRRTDAKVMATQRSAVSDLYFGAVAKRYDIVADVPVMRNGHVLYLLTMAVPPDIIAEDLTLGALKQDGWLAAVVGTDLRLIARTRSPQQYVGTRATSDVASALSGQKKGGSLHSVSLDGTDVLTTYVRSRFGWSIVVAVPAAVLDRPVASLVRLLTGLALAVLALSFLGAFVYGRVLGREVELLARNAGRVGSPTELSPSSHRVREMDEAHEALLAAHRHIQDLIRELNHRVKNTIAVIAALAGRTIADNELRAVLTGRIMALSRAHEILSRNNWTGADLSELVHAVARGQSLEILTLGPSVTLMPKGAIALSQTFQELLANAHDHGALRDPGGKVDVEWWVDGGTLRFAWNENCAGTRSELRFKPAFGLQIVELCIVRQLGGRYEIRHPPQGWQVRIAIPLEGELGLIGHSGATGTDGS